MRICSFVEELYLSNTGLFVVLSKQITDEPLFYFILELSEKIKEERLMRD
jgi:hypothetical protein